MKNTARAVFRSRYVAIVLAAILGTLASIGACLLVSSWEHRVAEIDFQSRAKSFLEVINDDLADARTLLYAMGAYFDTNEHVLSRRQFERFAQVLHEHVLGIRNISWAPRVSREGRAAFERQTLAAVGIAGRDRIVESSPRGALVTARERPTYYPILYVQTDPQYRKTALHDLLGFDLTSEPLRVAAIARTIRTGQPAATPPMRILGVAGAVDTAARLGGDEFAIVLVDTANLDFIAEVAERRISAVSQPFLIEGLPTAPHSEDNY